ncbi:uncharacterized protein LOC132273657 [Cornus florida]|uniref:uncharacterized protein LOC132273657 n=1 Tax=Cornus florida TaxID=4283 RepID=UPI0028A2B4FE|nr:uncharacterized protein LOC132273657 [Cornus florida]XP_059630627.1 uncharacterized protein LOC132273657 [Cornus florida]XP_059630628.1 uncharacterized protein LOC132273657 [Cornus florida]XP_059630629.1 uncharacterized protein LOC132273657 [Cornus florida]XP_059630630.1 uncharacterized protein LOC132273657 [Cornus florida]
MELVYVGNSEFVNDERLARRLKRKRLGTGNSELNTSSSTLERTLEENQLGDERLARRLKRKQLGSGNSELNTSSRTLERTLEENQLGDERLARRLKRKQLGTGNSELNTSSRTLERTLEENQLGDERLARRLKRRRLGTGNSDLNTSRSTLKRTLEENQLGDDIDEDYVSYLNYRESVDSVRESDDDDVCDEEDMDPDYKMFLENLRDGDSYELEVTMTNGRSLLIRYEKECELDNELELQSARKSGDCSNRENIGACKDVSVVLSKDKIQTQKTSRSILGKDKMEFPKSLENGVVDECYQVFLNCIELEGDCLVFVTENGKRVKYEEDDIDSSSDVEILEIGSTPSKHPFVASRMFYSSLEGDNWQCLGNSSESNKSQFREKVVGILGRPYDQEEYELLLHNIKVRKPVQRNLELRPSRSLKTRKPVQRNLDSHCSGPLFYQASNIGKSYLDHYDDLKSKIDEARFDRHKELNLLRGFFFWMQNLTHEGAFRPWLDSSCLEVMPGNR